MPEARTPVHRCRRDRARRYLRFVDGLEGVMDPFDTPWWVCVLAFAVFTLIVFMT